MLSAREAETIGLVTRVIANDQLMAHAQTLVAELAKGPTRAYEGVKRLLYGATNTSLAEQMEFETEWGPRIWPEPLMCKKGLPPFWPSDRRNSTAARRQSVDPTEASEAVV